MADAERLWCLDESGSVIWSSVALGLDGVVVHSARQGVVQGKHDVHEGTRLHRSRSPMNAVNSSGMVSPPVVGSATRAASEQDSGFRYHRKVGLVAGVQHAIGRRLRALAGTALEV